MDKKKRSISYFLLGLFAFSLTAFYFSPLLPSKVWAEDYEEDEREEEDREDEDKKEDNDERENSTSLDQTEIKKNVTTSTETISLPDSDGDGIIDKDDPHPEVAEIYVVEDKNLNGLVDKFEKNEK